MAVEKKKIICFIDHLGAGGAQRQLVGLAVMLKQKGYQVKVCYYQDVPFYAHMLDDAEVPHELILGADNHKKRIPIVARYFKKENPDWVITFLDTPSLVAAAAKVLGGKFKLIVSERNTTQRIGLNERVRFFLFHWADTIVTNSYSQADFLAAHYPWMKAKLQTINNFVDLEIFHPVERCKRDVPVLVIAATVWPQKNVLGFIEAVKILKEKSVKFLVEWYGFDKANFDINRQYYGECEHLLAQYQLTDVMKLLPKTNSIAEKYRAADFFCLPSFYEGTPNVICEAMASGLPIICSNVCDNPRYVHEGENGFLFDPLNPEEMADTIEKAIKMSNSKYSLFSRNCRKLSKGLFSKDRFISSYLQIVNRK